MQDNFAKENCGAHRDENHAMDGVVNGFMLAALTVVVWLVTGPIFSYSDTWQLVINTGTTIVTFLMVFLIQRTQNKDALALQLKLNELVAAMQGGGNRLISVEDLSEQELQIIHKHYQHLADMATQDGDIHESHSLDEARERHRWKRRRGIETPASVDAQS